MIHRIKCGSCGSKNAVACEPDDEVCAGCAHDEYSLALKRTYDDGEPFYNEDEITFIKGLKAKLWRWATSEGVTL